MSNQELKIWDEEYKNILANENRTAQIMTSKVLEKPEVSAWMILIPIVFIPFMQRYQRYKESAKVFSEGYLYTKQIALDTAYKTFKKDISCEDVPTIIKTLVQKNSDADPIVLNIYSKQIQEIEILFEHYMALLATGKVNYGEMVVSSYKSENSYLSFVNKLCETEKEVNRAASATFIHGVIEVPEIMEKMEKCLLEHRLKEARKIFLTE